MATQICVTLVERASEDDKIAAAKSGILPILKAILDDPPPPPTPTKNSGPEQEKAPEDVPLPESPTTATGEFPDGLISSLRVDDDNGPKSPVNEERARSIDVAPDHDPLARRSMKTTDQGGAIESDSNAAVAPNENVEESSRIEEPETIPPVEAGEGNITPSSELMSYREPTKIAEALAGGKTRAAEHPDGDTAVESPADTNMAPAAEGGAKQIRSPRAKAVTFDSVDRIIVVDTKSDADDDESSALACSPRPMHEASLRDGPEEIAENAKAAAKTDAKNREEIYQQAYATLDHILTEVSKDALDTIGEAYVAAGIHDSLVNAIELVSLMFYCFQLHTTQSQFIHSFQ